MHTPEGTSSAAPRSFFIKDRAFYQQFFAIVIPIALQNLLNVAVGLTDNMMVAQLGDVAVSAVYMANQVSNLLFMLLNGMSAALLILGSHYMGRDDTSGVRQVTAFSLRLGLVFAVPLMILVFIFPGPTLRLFTDEQPTIAAGTHYMRIVALSFPAFVIQGLLVAALRSVEAVRIGTAVTFVSLVSNVGLNYLLIFGHAGFPALGVDGAALATLGARLLSLLVTLLYVFLKDERLNFRLRDLTTGDPTLRRNYVRYGLPVIVGDITWGINLAVQGAIIGRLGEVAIAAIAIANTLFSLISVVNFAIRDASSMKIGQEVARGDKARLKQLVHTLQLLFVIFGVCSGVLLFLGRPFFLRFYENVSHAVRQETMLYLAILSVIVIGTSYQVGCLTGIVRAGGATSFVLWNDLAFVWLLVIPSAAIAAFVLHLPAYVVFACLKCDQILKCIVAFIKVNRYTWARNLAGGDASGSASSPSSPA